MKKSTNAASSILPSVIPSHLAKWVIAAAAADMLVTGVVTVISPSLFCQLVLGAKLSASGQALGPLAGIAMLGAGLAAWPTPERSSQPARVLRALITYNVLATIYLTYLGAAGLFVGVLLWPAVALHATLSVLLGHAWLTQRGRNIGRSRSQPNAGTVATPT